MTPGTQTEGNQRGYRVLYKPKCGIMILPIMEKVRCSPMAIRTIPGLWVLYQEEADKDSDIDIMVIYRNEGDEYGHCF